jgi:hypothetical protein
MGISSMSEFSCTTPIDRLDSVYGDATGASRDIAVPDFRGEKNCEQTGRASDFGGYSARAGERNARESVFTDSPRRQFGALWQAG